MGNCPNPCVSPPLLAAMWDAERRNHHKGAYISASMLPEGSCSRQTWFERQPDVEVYETARRRFWPFRGTIIHNMIEGQAELMARYGWLQELRLAVPLIYPEHPKPLFDDNGDVTGFDSSQPLEITLGGTLDAYNPFIRRLDDFKTKADADIDQVFKGQAGEELSQAVSDSWVWQTNTYAWMLGRTPIPEEIRDTFVRHGLRRLTRKCFPTPRLIKIQLISMKEIPLTGAEYVRLRDKSVYRVDDVPVLPQYQVEAFVRERALQWYRWLVLREKPPVVSEEKKWMCKSCPFNAELHPDGLCSPTSERAAVNPETQG